MPRQHLVPRAIIALGAVGLASSLVMLYVHHQLAVGGGEYTSFCNVSSEINCDAVLGSRYAHFLGTPVAAWTAGWYVGVIALAAVGGALARFGLAALGGASVGYSIVLAIVSVVVLRTVCLLCASLYVVNLALAALAWVHVARLGGNRRAAAAVLGPLVLAVAVGYGATRTTTDAATETLTAAEIAAREPEFYRWYISQPVVPGAVDAGSGPGHARGPRYAAVTIVEFSDFDCSHCARAHRALKAMLARYPDDVRLIFRHFPLDSSCNPGVARQLHPTACEAAVAAECAGEQGRFWEYHDALFERQGDMDHTALAADLGLQAEAFRACLGQGSALATVKRDVARGVALRVQSTPTSYLNGRIIEGALAEPLYDRAIVIEKARVERGRGAERR